jgi:DNA repair photolyase
MTLNLKVMDYPVIRQHDSWLSVDPIVGCSYDCKYCILRVNGLTGQKPQRILSVEETIRILRAHRYFVPGKTVISFGNNTDAFLPENEETTLDFIRTFRSLGYNNPLEMATKTPISERVATEISQNGNAPIFLFVSYSRLGQRIERGVNEKSLKNSFKILSDAGVTVLHFWRPLVAANGNLEIISDVLETVFRYSKASVCIGLKYSPKLYKMFQDSNELVLPQELAGKSGNYLDDQIVSRILSVAARDYPGYPIFFRTACAVIYMLGRSDYIACHGTDICRISHCPTNQRDICSQQRFIPDNIQIATLLSRIGLKIEYQITRWGIVFDEPLSQEDYVFLLHNTQCKIFANIIRTTEWKGHILPE